MLNDIFPKPSAFKHGKIVYFKAMFLKFIKRLYKRDDLNLLLLILCI